MGVCWLGNGELLYDPGDDTMKVIVALIGLLLPLTAAADPFDPPQGGKWVCPDGSISYVAGGRCMPPELNGVQWWLSCLPQRDDCVRSDTALIGWDVMGRAQRGSGYCYTGQPYTCSPDGKLP
jgi:hypothetical protein